jgi:hypothetical protein
MHCLRSQQNGFCLLNAFAPPDRIAQADPPDLIFRFNLYKVATNRGGHIPFLSRHIEVHACPKDFIAVLSSGSISSRASAASSNIPSSQIAT